MKNIIFPEKKETYQLFNKIAEKYDFLNHLFSFGQDIAWRKTIAYYLPSHKTHLRLLDLATGTGDVALELAHDKRIESITAMDLSQVMLEKAKLKGMKIKEKQHIHKMPKTHKADKRHLAPIHWVVGDGVEIPVADSSYDAVTLSFGLRNFHDPKRSLENIYRVLTPGGRVLIMEFSMPSNPIMKFLFLAYFRYLLPLIGHVFTGHGDIYRYFNRSVEGFPYGDSFIQMLRQQNFTNIQTRSYSFGVATLYVGEK